MDALKAQLARIQEQLGALSASQKMLAGSLMAIMVLTLLFWSRYAGTADMEPVLDETVSTEELGRIQMELRKAGVEYKLVADRVVVPSERKLEALAILSYAQAVPQNTRSTYDEIIKRITPWSSQSDNDATRNDAKTNLLAQIIRKWPAVQSADVIIDPTYVRQIGGGSRQPRASVLITTRDPKNRRADRSLVEAAAATVAGAQSGLDLSQITVIVNGLKHNVGDPDSMGIGNGDEMLSREQEAEQFFTQKVTKQLEWAGAVLVTVTCDLNIKSESRSEEVFDPKGAVQKERETTQSNTDETAPSGAPSSGEPGAMPNSSMSVDPSAKTAAGSGGGSTHEQTVTKFDNKFSNAKIETHTPAGKVKVVGAAVRVPRSYFVGLYKMMSGNSTKEPDENVLQPIYAAELPKIREEVKRCTAITSDDDVLVQPYPDTLMMAGITTTPLVGAQPGPSSSIGPMVLGHYKELVIGLLAVVSLFMVSSIVKKTAPAPALAPAMELKEIVSLPGGEDMAGEVGEGAGELSGMELDDDTIKAQQMVEQVSTMVKENPDGAANLVKRWLNRN